MHLYKKLQQIALLAILLLSSVNLLGQAPSPEYDKAKFAQLYTEAEYHVLYDNYSLALPMYLELYAMDSTNANINFKIGMCYMNSNFDKEKGIKYLKVAVGNASDKYEEFEAGEKRAPESAWYYLAKAYHFHAEFDNAIATFNKYKELIGTREKKVTEDVDKQLDECRFGKELVKNPLDMRIINIGDSINSKYPDYAPVVSADENTIIFTSRREGSTGGNITDDGQYYEDIYISNREDRKSPWSKAVPISTNINTADHEASVSVSFDEQELIIYRSVKGDGGLYKSIRQGSDWSVPDKLGSDVNTKYWETHAGFTAKNDVLYFTSNRPGGQGGRDIYKVTKLPTGEWSLAVNLGPSINTPFDEDAPFMHPDNKHLYFASKGHLTMGGFDIQVAELNEDGTWSSPVNIGYPINTTDDDLFFTTSPDGKRAYYSSARDGGFGEKDIYVIELTKEEIPLTLLIGKLYLTTGEKTLGNNSITVTKKGDGTLYGEYKAKSNGRYTLILPPGETYIITYNVDTYDPYTMEFEVPKGTAYQEIEREVEMIQVGLGKSKLKKQKGTVAAIEEPKEKGAKKEAPKTKEEPKKAGETAKPATQTPTAAEEKKTIKEGEATPPAAKTKEDKKAVEATKETAVIPEKKPVVAKEKKEVKVNIDENEAVDYQINFKYNVTEVNTDADDFKTLVDKVVSLAGSQNKVNVKIESSASFVPTSKYSGNPELAKLRGENAQAKLIAATQSKGVAKDKLSIKINAQVQGPPYNNDYLENKPKYEAFQYVKITAK